VQTVGYHHDPGRQMEAAAVAASDLDAADPVSRPDQPGDGGVLQKLDARFDGGVHQQLVEDGPPRAVCLGDAPHGRPDPGQRHRA
jgi:hypothetical protein